MNVMLWRELKGQLTSPVSAVGVFLNPVFYLVFFAMALGTNVSTIIYQGVPVRYVEFFIPGLLGNQSFAVLSTTFSLVRLDRATNMISVLVSSTITPRCYLAGKLVSSTATVFIKGLLIIATSGALGFLPPIETIRMTTVFVGLLMGSLTWCSLGFLAGVFIIREDIRDIVFSLLTLPITFTSSMYYNLGLAPKWLQVIGGVNPLTYVIEFIRLGFFGMEVPTDLTIKLVLSTAATLVAAVGFSERLMK